MRSDRLRLRGLAVSLALAAPAAAQVSFAAPREPSHIDRYVLPEQCLSAVEHTRDSLNWGRVRDTVQSHYNDTMPAPAVAVARRCIERFPLEQAEPIQLPVLFRLALDADDDSLATRVITRRIAHAAGRSVATRAGVLRDVVGALMTARPQRLMMAQPYVDRLDALGPDAAYDAAGAHGELVTYALVVLDLPLITRESARELAALDAVPPAKRDGFRWPWRQRQARAAALVPAILDDRSTAKVAFGLVGQRAPAVHGDFWFGHPDSAAAPRTGKVTLVLFDSAANGVSVEQVHRYALVRRLKQRHPEIDVVIVTQTLGYFWQREPPAPDVEAHMDRDFYLDREGLPALVSVTARPFTRLPEPDGRYIPGPVANDSAYQRNGRPGDLDLVAEGPLGPVSFEARDPDVFVVDRTGTVRFEYVLDAWWEAALDAMITKLLEAPAAAAR